MPDMAVHYYFGQSVRASLPHTIKLDQGVFDFALSGPDDWFYCFWSKKLRSRARLMHNTKTGLFLRSLAAEPELFSYFAGFVCHYALDAICHPYIIVRTGMYDGTRRTRQYIGRHTALERALDRWILGENAGKHPITEKMLGRKLPQELASAINRAYHSTYGWDDVYKDLLAAKQHMRRYLRILENPDGMAKYVTYLVPHPFLKPLPYARHFFEDADILNTRHKEWHHPKDLLLSDNRSFPELMEDAEQMAVQIIEAAAHGDVSQIGNRSYITGMELDDIRNNAPDTYVLLPGM